MARRDPYGSAVSYGLMGPSWSFEPYGIKNGRSLLGAAAGLVAVVLAFPAGPFGPVLPVLAVAMAVWGGITGRRRALDAPWRRGRRLAAAALGLAAVASVLVVLQVAWPST